MLNKNIIMVIKIVIDLLSNIFIFLTLVIVKYLKNDAYAKICAEVAGKMYVIYQTNLHTYISDVVETKRL